MNGEGYKKIQYNDGLNYGLGVTITPVKGFQIRLYGGVNESGEKGKKDIVSMAAFAGYKCDKFTIGAEYNHLLNASYKNDADQYGYSLYASVKLAKYADLYARFDDLFSKNDWNIAKDEQTAMLGAQFKLGKYVKIAPNFRMNLPKANITENGYSAYISCYFGI